MRAPHGAARSACQARCESGPTALAPPSHSHQRHLGHHCQHDLDHRPHKSNIIVIINLITDAIVGHLYPYLCIIHSGRPVKRRMIMSWRHCIRTIVQYVCSALCICVMWVLGACLPTVDCFGTTVTEALAK